MTQHIESHAPLIEPSAQHDRKSGPEAEDRVYWLVHDEIQSHRLQPGQRLVERQLSEMAGANRQAVRNALLRLSQAGLVHLTRHQGARVMQCSPDTTQQIMKARIVNEGAALRMLAGSLDEPGRDRLQTILRHEAAAYDEGQLSEARQMSRAFHVAFTELAGNEMMARFVRDLIDCQPLLGARKTGRQSAFSGVAAHTKTLAALLRGDGAQAEAVNTELLLALEREFLREHAEGPT
ncbi:GntR family transcriptional regulator [Xinfangfangia sp. CPCC 101601]|uniref:GntR family transcriptional regulator n=1 Tax=Pseudogemmobacter lacusdianii TaxID=3069608 RepID=A0ABU0W1X8_9RHOB|nr:GntR family transcriptional regulator [Xinfangfangia sp. CPCC 101601]MDQ2067898.1 GntR family transcriptional regulator [Xinfangfangia sp. CPCC 101601]